MGKQFDVVYDDFTGGHFMGPSQANQPRNTWTGPNVICTADQGFLMPDGGWRRQATASTSPTSAPAITNPHTYPPSTLASASAYTLRAAWGNSLNTSIFYAIPEINGTGTIGTIAAVPSDSAHVTMINNRLGFVNGAGASTAYLVTATGVSTAVTTQTNFSLGMWWWANFGFGASLSSTIWNRLYFSAAGDPTSWPAANYVDVGTLASPIMAVIPTNDALYIGKTEGWWILSGVPGQTATLRRLTRLGIVGPAGNTATPVTPTWAAAAAESRQGILFRSERGPHLNVLRGTQVDQFASFPFGIDVGFVVPSAENILVQVNGATTAAQSHLYVWSDAQRRWRHKPMPTPASASATAIRWHPVTDPDVYADSIYSIAIETFSASSFAEVGYYAAREPLDPQTDVNGYYDTAIATLAEYSQATPFAVKEMVVELDFGQPTTQGAQRSVEASVITQSVTDLDQTFPIDTGDLAVPYQSSQFTKTWQNANSTRRGHRQTIRFQPTDGAQSTLTAAPVIEMTGVKVRRVILRCETV